MTKNGATKGAETFVLRRADTWKILLIRSGPIVIGQAYESGPGEVKEETKCS